MSHKSKPHHVHVLMSGHNPGHNNTHHHSGGSHSSKPSDVLMRQHHFAGGISNVPPRYATGGHVDYRKHRAEGGETDKEYGSKPLSGQLRRGGRAHHRSHHAEGMEVQDNSVRQEQKRGGRSKRQHHYWGQDVIGRLPLVGGIANSIANTAGTLDDNQYGGANYVADTPGRKVADVASTVGNLLPLAFLKKGGKVHRKHHSEGAPVMDNSVRKEQSRGGRTKRKGHYWGQDVIGRLPLIGGVANSIANTVGTLDDNQYGGANYVADTAGRKAADIASTVGNLGLNLLMAKGNSKGKGAPAAPKRKGGEVRQHHAAGGAGKVRKGMMTESGHMIHSK